MKYTYDAAVNRVVDGDTVILDVDLGFGVWLRSQSFRLIGLNAREKSEAGGPEARSNLEKLLPIGTLVSIASIKTDKYGGRYDAALALPDGRSLNTLLIQTGWAAPWTGAGPKPVPLWPRPEPT